MAAPMAPGMFGGGPPGGALGGGARGGGAPQGGGSFDFMGGQDGGGSDAFSFVGDVVAKNKKAI